MFNRLKAANRAKETERRTCRRIFCQSIVLADCLSGLNDLLRHCMPGHDVGAWYFPSTSLISIFSPQRAHVKSSFVTMGLTLLTLTTVPFNETNFPA